ncbi:MAG: matrixin family metalloprotease [Pyrinomonadaceae bacterium]|nr:matrixin family metalloprotease [Pyrinomonadaceae bacterium]
MANFRKILIAGLAALIAVQTAFAEPPGPVAQKKLRWNTDTIRIAISRSILSAANISGANAIDAVKRGVRAWEASAGVEFEIVLTDRESSSGPGAAGDGISLITIAPNAENMLIFGRDDLDAAAKTRIFYNRKGSITEADIVLNPTQQFSTDGAYGAFDLESTITHEVGHLLGLRHSNVVGSVMYPTTARNGSLGIPGVLAREIAEVDMAGLRELYSQSGGDACCGVVSGKLTSNPRGVRATDIWAEDAFGRVVAETTAATDGSFRFGGINANSVSVYARPWARVAEYSVFPVGDVTFSEGGSAINRRVQRQVRGFSIAAIGLNGLLSDAALRMLPGQTYNVILGGERLSADGMNIFTTSPYFAIDRSSIRDLDYGEGVTAITFVITVDDAAPAGNYSIYAADRSGATDALPGAIIVPASQR